MTADAAGVSERERSKLLIAKLLFSCDISDRAGSNAPEIMDSCERAAAVLLAAGFGDVAAAKAEALRDAAAATELGDVRPRFNVRQRKWLLDRAAEYRTPSANGGAS